MISAKEFTQQLERRGVAAGLTQQLKLVRVASEESVGGEADCKQAPLWPKTALS